MSDEMKTKNPLITQHSSLSTPIHGRGASWNPQNRFETIEYVHDEEAEEQPAAHALFTDYLERSHDFDPVVLHGDLGPEHLLAKAGRLSGVIDWGDARIGDPALDLAWLLYGTGASFATEVLRAYGGDGDLRRRALYFRRLGPWHEVLFGLKHDRPKLVDSGLMGVRARLP